MSQYERIKTKHRLLREDFEDGLSLRVHRALSWIQAAEAQDDGTDECFILYWIALNAAYAEYRPDEQGGKDREGLSRFLTKIVRLDANKMIYHVVWDQYSGSIRGLLANEFIFSQFWHFQNGLEDYADWQMAFEKRSKEVGVALAKSDTIFILDELFARLYVLRNQIIHGGATWAGKVNRAQVQDAGRLLGALVPAFVELMMDYKDAEWGQAHYPVVNR